MTCGFERKEKEMKEKVDRILNGEAVDIAGNAVLDISIPTDKRYINLIVTVE